jgi:hypothetical protein
MAVGAVANPATVGAERDAAVWASQDGLSWHRVALDGHTGDDILERVIATPSGLVAAGLAGTRFDSWSARPDGSGWTRVGHFADHGPVTSVPRVIDLARAPADRGVYAAISTGAAAQLWHLTGAQAQQVTLPPEVHDIAGLTGDGTTALLATGAGMIWATG